MNFCKHCKIEDGLEISMGFVLEVEGDKLYQCSACDHFSMDGLCEKECPTGAIRVYRKENTNYEKISTDYSNYGFGR